MIEVADLSKFYGTFPALKGISFTVSRGEIVGFLGPNGAGKTTAMRILTGYLKPTNGTAQVAGFDVLEDPLSVQRKIGYLPETNPLYLEMTVQQVLDFVGDVRGMAKQRRSERMALVVRRCGLETVLRKGVGELSKGFRQRVGLAQALLHDPDLLILDEPTSGLDPKQIIEIRELIKTLGKEKTVILSTHILPEVNATCSRVIIISEGSIVATGDTAELQSRAGAQGVVITRIKGPSEKVTSALKSIEGVSGVEAAAETSNGFQRYAIRCANPDEAAEAVYQRVSEGGWVLRELRMEAASLEDIFLKLTTRE